MFGFKRRIYLDYASATPIVPAALKAYFHAAQTFANPGAIHAEGVMAQRMLTDSRERIAAHLGCKARELIFTSGLTEANMIAIVGTARALELRNRSLQNTHWIVSSIEHSSVLQSFVEIERMGGTVSHVDPESNGIVTVERIVNTLRPNTVFASVGWGNNEIGTIQPISKIARTLRSYGKVNNSQILFHCDAGQAPLYRASHVHTLGVDMFALGSGKLYGPRGIGCLYLSNRSNVAPISFGGGQERGLRPGTEDHALAVGFAEAFDIITRERELEANRLLKLRNTFMREILARIRNVVINGDLAHAMPHILNISIPGERSGEYLVLALDHAGVALSTKSACREGEARSHVVETLGGDPWRAQNTLRFSLGRDTTERDLRRVITILEGLFQT